MKIYKFNHELETSTNKWIGIGCPLMVLCIGLFLLPSLILKDNSCSTSNGSTPLQIAINIIPSQLVFIVPILVSSSFVSKHISVLTKLGLLKWNFSHLVEAIMWELILIIPLLVLATISYFICLYFGYNFTSPVMDLLSKTNKYGIGLIFIFAVFIAPIIEEIAFRRVLFVFIGRMFGVFASSVTSSLIFAFMHGGVVQIMPLFVLAMVLQYLYLKHGTLAPSIFLHACHNLTIVGLYIFIRT